MLTSLMVGAVIAAPTNVVATKVTSASLFKNGYAVVIREAPLTSSEILIENVPQAALGTLWITGSDGVKIKEVIGTQRETKSEVPAKNMDELIAANVGKEV